MLISDLVNPPNWREEIGYCQQKEMNSLDQVDFSIKPMQVPDFKEPLRQLNNEPLDMETNTNTLVN